MSGKVLIASSSLDKATWSPIVSMLFERGHDVVVLETDRIALGDTPLQISITNESGVEARYAGALLPLDSVGGAWFRRTTFLSDTAGNDDASQLGLDMERRALLSALWDEVPECAWLNSPHKISAAERKLRQLTVAHDLGFTIPYTVVSNQWEPIQQLLPTEIICKASYSAFYDGTEFKTFFTTRFNNDPALPLESNPYPGIWQPLLRKAREWRVTAIGHEVFPAAVYTTSEAKDDWRKHQAIPSRVEFRKDHFPDELADKCIAYLRAFGLRFGAFDFIEDEDGKVTFLECNPNGQFRWLEDQLGLPISEAIATELTNFGDGGVASKSSVKIESSASPSPQLSP